MIELLPCPFCGQKAEITVKNGGYTLFSRFTQSLSVGCSDDNCKARIAKYFDHEFEIDSSGKMHIVRNGYEQAAASWNRRIGRRDHHAEG